MLTPRHLATLRLISLGPKRANALPPMYFYPAQSLAMQGLIVSQQQTHLGKPESFYYMTAKGWSTLNDADRSNSRIPPTKPAA